MADFFARYMRCPTPYLVYKRIDKAKDIQLEFGVSSQMAEIAENNVKQRVKRYENKIFDYELPILRLLLGDEFDLSKIEVIKT